MAANKVWKPTDEDRMDWNHPYIQMTRRAPGYLVQEMHRFSDNTWAEKLTASRRKGFVLDLNRQAWIPIEHIAAVCNEGKSDEADHGTSG